MRGIRERVAPTRRRASPKRARPVALRPALAGSLPLSIYLPVNTIPHELRHPCVARMRKLRTPESSCRFVTSLDNEGALDRLRVDEPLLEKNITEKLVCELRLLKFEPARQIGVT
jgi:hypothetical protein